MIPSSLPSRSALVLLAMLAAGCAGRDAAPEAPAEATAIVAGEAAAPPAAANAVDAGAPDAQAGMAATMPEAADGPDAAADASAGPGAEDVGAAPAPPAAIARPEAWEFDPWERTNRRVFAFNDRLDRAVIAPVARTYQRAVPGPVRTGVSNFFNNLYQPVAAVNLLLQGHPKEAGQATGRFLLNATLGLGGVLDPASDANIPMHEEDLGQTLARWGWRRSRYIVVPFMGPRTVRDFSGGLAEAATLGPTTHINDDSVRYPLQALYLVDLRARLFGIEGFNEGAQDEYALLRDAWIQRREYQINDRGEGSLRRGVLRALPPSVRERINEQAPPQQAVPAYLDDELFDEIEVDAADDATPAADGDGAGDGDGAAEDGGR
jgi:phospholipid-binding lipoprotein MlaA